jgi:hypothetical protein
MEILHGKYQGLISIAPMPEASHTLPNIILKPSSATREVGDTEGFIANPKEVE